MRQNVKKCVVNRNTVTQKLLAISFEDQQMSSNVSEIYSWMYSFACHSTATPRHRLAFLDPSSVVGPASEKLGAEGTGNCELRFKWETGRSLIQRRP